MPATLDPDSMKALCARMGELYREMEDISQQLNGDDVSPDKAAELEKNYASKKGEWERLSAKRERSEFLMRAGGGATEARGARRGDGLGDADVDAAGGRLRFDDMDPGEVRHGLPAWTQLSREEREQLQEDILDSKGWAGWVRNRRSKDFKRAYRSLLKRSGREGGVTAEEFRVLQEAVDADGGYLAPQAYFPQLSKLLQHDVTLRKIGRVIPVGAFKTNIAVQSNLLAATYTAEGTAFDVANPQFGTRVAKPRRCGTVATVTIEAAEDIPARGADFSIETLLTEQFRQAFALAEENYWMTGDGVNQPKGLLTYTGGGEIGTGVTLAATGAVTVLEIENFIYSLKRQYRANATILMNDSTLAAIRQLPNIGNYGQWWQPSAVQGEPDRIAGIPVLANNYMPALGAANIVAMIGDFSYAWIMERSALSIRVLRERYADSGLIGYLGVARNDIVPAQYEAFKYLKCHA